MTKNRTGMMGRIRCELTIEELSNCILKLGQTKIKFQLTVQRNYT